jgi:D-alanyl-D-alanine dipeptidase
LILFPEIEAASAVAAKHLQGGLIIKKLLLLLIFPLLLCLSSCGKLPVEAVGGEPPSESQSVNEKAPPSPTPQKKPSPTPSPSLMPTPTQSPTPSPSPAIKTLDDVFTYNGLVDIEELDPRIGIDCRYATANNFASMVFHPFSLALMQKEVAEMFMKAQDLAWEQGYRLRVYDAYRPLLVQRQMFEATTTGPGIFVAAPTKSARHCMGMAIDCGLSAMDGTEIAMPAPYNEFSEKGYAYYTGGSPEETAHLKLLQSIMTEVGFIIYNMEWWHFTAPNTKGLVAMDMPFQEFVDKRSEYYASLE